MDQGVLESVKRIYRKQLMRDLVQVDTEMIPFLRALNMRDVVDRAAIAWDYVSQTTLRLSWRKLIPFEENVDSPSDTVDTELLKTLQEVDPTTSVADITEWFECDGSGYEHMTEERIVKLVTHEDSETDADDDDIEVVEKPVVCPVSNSEAMQAFDVCLTWLRHQEEATAVNTSTLLQLKELAAQKRGSTIKQASILSYFKPV